MKISSPMKSSSHLFAGLFVLFFGMLGCEKEDVNPSPIYSILGEYDVKCCSYDIGKRMKVIPKNDSVIDIRILSDYPNNLIVCNRVYKDLTIIQKRSPWLVYSVFFYIYNSSHQQVGDIRTPRAGIYLELYGAVDSISQEIHGLQATKRKD